MRGHLNVKFCKEMLLVLNFVVLSQYCTRYLVRICTRITPLDIKIRLTHYIC